MTHPSRLPVEFPSDEWLLDGDLESLGVDPGKWESFKSSLNIRGASWEGEDHTGNQWGVVVTRRGRVIGSWGDPEYRFQTASVGKAFTWAAFGLAHDAGMVDPDDPVNTTWTGEGELSHEHKFLDRGHHTELTWRHLLGSKSTYGHDGGFPVTNGYYWRKRSSAQMSSQKSFKAPDWAEWTGDPFFDNYSHAKPGTERIYSSGGIWRLSQALTVLWQQDLKQVLDDGLMSKIGIPPDRWDWFPGKAVHDDPNWYPNMPGYGDFIDPPYEIAGRIIRGGGGWVVISAADLARFGLLVATEGKWDGEQVIGNDWLRGHGGGNGSLMNGDPETLTSIGVVTAEGFEWPLPGEVFDER